MYKRMLNFKAIYNSQYVGCGNCCLPCSYVWDMWQFIKKRRKYDIKDKYNFLKLRKVFKSSLYYKRNKLSFR